MDRPIYLRDEERRVLANLSQPRSVPELARQLAVDRFAPFDKRFTVAELGNAISAVLRELAEEGLAKNVGLAMTAEQAVAVVTRDGDVPNLQTEKAQQFIDFFDGRGERMLREGDLWYWTNTGRELLTTT